MFKVLSAKQPKLNRKRNANRVTTQMKLSIKNIFFKNTDIKTFFVTRLKEEEVNEEISLLQEGFRIDITNKQSMICLDPFCIAVWLPENQLYLLDPEKVVIEFTRGRKINALLNVSLIEEMDTENGSLLLYKLDSVKNYQLNPLHRLALFAWLLRSKKNTYQSRRVISALYSYPRKIIIVSYQDDEYCNIFPMDIQGYIPDEGLYILGLRTTNVTLNKIIGAGKVVICDTDAADLDVVYNLGRHPSVSPTQKQEMPFKTTDSDLFKFPVPEFSASYKEVKIIAHRKMGYHMLLVGKVAHQQVFKPDAASLYHVSFLQFQQGDYTKIEGLY